jgi:hypothetical protein
LIQLGHWRGLTCTLMGSKEGERVRVSETIDEWALANRRNTKKTLAQKSRHTHKD